MELGRGTSASLETWCAVAAALGAQFVGFIEDVPGAERPRDYQHLLRQQLVIHESSRGDWSAAPEQSVADGPAGWRYVDVLLRRQSRREVAVVEIWDWLDDVGNALRGLRTKMQRIADAAPESTVSGLMVVRGTARNRRLVSTLGGLFAAALPGSSNVWLRALTDPDQPMPPEPGLIWTNVAGTRMFALRQRSAGTPGSGPSYEKPGAGSRPSTT